MVDQCQLNFDKKNIEEVVIPYLTTNAMNFYPSTLQLKSQNTRRVNNGGRFTM
jgi:hypothetical protein